MKIKFLGATGTVTGSGYLLATNQSQVMVDFGMFQGTNEEQALNRKPLTFDPKSVNALFLTHAHLDHCGRLPLLVKLGFRGPIYATPATQDLAEIVLLDSARIADQDMEHDPLYSEDDVTKTLDLFKSIDYHEPLQYKNLEVEYIDAGHIIGSASIKIMVENKKIIFSGDLGAFPDYLVKPTEFFDSADVVIMESTYGGRAHPNENPKKLLLEHLNWAENQKGTLLIPSFAIQKTQVLLSLIKELKDEGNIAAKTTVFLDSPMAVHATEVYKHFSYLLNKKSFNFPGLKVTTKSSQSRHINEVSGPKIIIAGSGMMTGGRILNHAQKYLSRKNTRLLFVGYQAVETIGRALKEGAESIVVYDEDIKVNAEIKSIESLSSHADEPRLLEWLRHINHPSKVILTHGEDESRIQLASTIRRTLNISEVVLPKLDQELDL